MSDNHSNIATRVLTSLHVFTGVDDTAQPLAVGLRSDRICWVCAIELAGSARFPMAPEVEVLDYGDAFIMPGFHDAHLHFFHSALYGSPLAERFIGNSEQDCVSKLASLAARRPSGSWLLTQGWREYLWNPPIMPTKASLDAAYPDRPVAMYSGDAHTLWLNSCAMQELGLHADSQPPAGGAYERDETGELSGIVRETAAMELMPQIMAAFSNDEFLQAYRDFQAQLNSHGITAICDMALSATPGLDFVRDDLFSQLESSGELTVRTHLFPTLFPGTKRLRELQATLNGPMLRACGFKQFFDGVSSQHTAWLHEPYTNAKSPDEKGRPTVDPSAMENMVCAAVANGNSVRIHTIGDEAIHRALDIYELALSSVSFASPSATKQKGNAPVLTLEHLENFQPSDISRLAQLGVIASVQPRHMTLDPGGPERDLGSARVAYMWPLRTLLDSGATLAFGTDSPVTDIDPLAAVYTAVTRRDSTTRQPTEGWLPSERITVAEALRAYTLGSAIATGRDRDLGTLEPCKFADITILSQNPLTIDPEKIPDIKVIATYVAANRVFPK